MAGEEVEVDENVPKNKRMQSKTTWQRFKIVIAGALNNFILGIVCLIVCIVVTYLVGDNLTKSLTKISK